MSDAIGLKQGRVKLVAHDSRWAKLFEHEKKLLLKKFPTEILEISHGGSTAIPGIPAKPIIDMFAVVPTLETAKVLTPRLEALGYEYRGKEGVSGRVLYVKGSPENRTYHLQLVERNGDEWNNHILIRDYYLRHPDAAQKYAALKKELSERYPNDRPAYRADKDAFIKSVIKKAKEEAGLA